LLNGLHVVGSGLFGGDPHDTKEPNMTTIGELIEALLPLLPDAEVTREVIIRTGLSVPDGPTPTLT
jgi:hypothetical protein